MGQTRGQKNKKDEESFNLTAGTNTDNYAIYTVKAYEQRNELK
jgi:hypothetical protein